MAVIEARGLTKRYGDKTVVDRLSFTVRPGEVTGFLGPNGAGKSTTMRMIVGLDAPSKGSVKVNGRLYAQQATPLREIGVLLDAKAVHPGRSAFGHLMALAYTHGIARRRVEEVIELAGLGSVARKRVGAFSLGMGQRLGIAAALLGDPAVVLLDEPVNGLDPEGVLWVRNLLSGLAAEGRAVMLSSHLMSEMELIADHLVIIGRGRLLADTSLTEFKQQAGGGGVRVVTDDTAKLRGLLAAPGVSVASAANQELLVHGLTAREIGVTAAYYGIPLFELTPQSVSLETAFMQLTHDAVEYHSAGGGAGQATGTAADHTAGHTANHTTAGIEGKVA
ncbi:ABC-2 type transport system ATP-binding protein [Catenulispora sp. EB89]